MKILVLIKQVPDMEKVKFDSEKGVVDRKSAGAEINPFDLNAIEAAVQIKEMMSGKVTAITMGPPSAESALREAISRGADEGVLVSDRAFGGSDTKATSATLTAAIKKLGVFDLIFAGEKTVDGDTGQVGPETAEYLNIPHVSFVNKIEKVNEESIEVVSEIWEGSFLKRMQFPGLITVTKAINSPRLPSFKSKMYSKKVEITKFGFEALSDYISDVDTGFRGSPTKVKKIVVPEEQRRQCTLYRDQFDMAIEEIFGLMSKKNIMQ